MSPKWAKIRAKNGPKRGQKGVKSGRKSIEIVVLRERPKGGVRRFLESFLENFLVGWPQNGPRKSSKGFSSLVWKQTDFGNSVTVCFNLTPAGPEKWKQTSEPNR